MPLLFYFGKNLPRYEKEAHCGGGFTYIIVIMLFQLSALLLDGGLEPGIKVAVDGFEGGEAVSPRICSTFYVCFENSQQTHGAWDSVVSAAGSVGFSMYSEIAAFCSHASFATASASSIHLVSVFSLTNSLRNAGSSG